jgi:hypothetical protein
VQRRFVLLRIFDSDLIFTEANRHYLEGTARSNNSGQDIDVNFAGMRRVGTRLIIQTARQGVPWRSITPAITLTVDYALGSCV